MQKLAGKIISKPAFKIDIKCIDRTDIHLAQLVTSSKKSWLTQSIIKGLQFAHLFAKLSQPGDNEVTFADVESSCHLLLPV